MSEQNELETEIPPEEKQLEEAAITDSTGKKNVMVPLPELLEERRSSRDLKGKVKELETTAGRVPQLESQLAQMNARLQQLEPDAEAMRRLPPEIAEAARRGKVADPEIPDEEAEETAKDLGLYSTDGRPDLAAARRVIKRESRRVDSIVQREVTKHVTPVKNMAQAQQATYLQNAAMAKAREGYCKPETLEKVIANLAPELRSDPNVMNAALVMARGIDGPGTVLETNEPVFTESSGGRRSAPGAMSSIEERATKDKGISSKEWTELTDKYKPGQSFRVE